jgi:hypothetical protein
MRNDSLQTGMAILKPFHMAGSYLMEPGTATSGTFLGVL